MSDTLLNLKDGAVGKLRRRAQTLTASGALNNGMFDTFFLSHATVVIAATLPKPKDGDTILIYNNSASGTVAHTVTLPSGYTWEGTNDVVTLDAPGEFLYGIFFGSRCFIIASNGAEYS